MSTIRLRGGRVYDPTNGIDGELRDIGIRDGRIVELHPQEKVDHDYDLAGCVVMAGGIDLHTHIGGGKVNLARMLLPEDHRTRRERDNLLELASGGCCTPGTLQTGYRYAEMGYTAAFEPAMLAANARQAHMEMGDTPILDHGAYVMLGNEEVFLEMLARGEDFERIRDYVGWSINASKAMGVKVVNPGGISAFKFNQRKLDVDENHVHWQITPRRVVHTLARALRESGFAAPRLAVTARADADAEAQARAAGFDGFLRKPVTGDLPARALAARREVTG